MVEKIAAMCPFEQNYQRYTEHEYFTRLPKRADHSGCELTHNAYKNQVFYFQGWNAFTILFGDCDTTPFDVVHLGNIVEDVVPQLQNAGAAVPVRCELEE